MHILAHDLHKNIFPMKKTLIAGGICMLLGGYLQAQETNFDLSSQRSEIQDVRIIPGEKVNHQGIVINPTPHQMTLNRDKRVDVSGGLTVKDKQKKFSEDLKFLTLTSKGVKLTIDFGTKVAQKEGVKAVSGAYALHIGEKGISIIGYDERGAFYGIQTLRQLLESPFTQKGGLPYADINDWPDLPNRGVVEGFYGTPWSHQVRLSLIDFYGKFKMNAYLYGPKDDPYHSSPNWRLPYPEQEAKQIHELIEACKRNRVDFVWAIHPGKDIQWNEEDFQNLVHKFNLMYDLGVRDFAVFFDDISGRGANPTEQAKLLNRLTKEFVEAKGDVSPLTVCPTDYSKLWANPSEKGNLAIYGRELEKNIKVFWTGDVVCSDLTPSTLEFVNTRIQRPAYYWWNYPVTDYARHIIMQGPVYGLDTTLTEKDVCGLISNPMEHGEASKLALYGVADYAWNIADYNAIDNWERGLVELAPDASDAYRTFAIHSGDTETGYRRDESWETHIFRLADWTDAAAQALEAEYKRVEQVPAQMEKGCANKALLEELRPWLVEFGKLGTRGKRAIELGRIYRKGNDNAAFWNLYVKNLMTPEDRKAYEAHKSGTMKLQPFYENMMDDMSFGFLQKLTGEVPKDYRGIGSFSNSSSTLTKLMLDNDSVSFYTSGVPQRKDSWIGLDLRTLRDVSEISILQGRNSVDDVDYMDHAALEYSADGKTWTPLIADMKQQYIINWKGTPVKARYIRLKRLESKRTNYAAVRSFDVNPLRVENLGFTLEATQPTEALYAFDGTLGTSYQQTGALTFGVSEGTQRYILLMNQPAAAIKCQQLDKDGKVLAESLLSTPYAEIQVAGKEVVKIRLEGTTEIFEIIPCK